MSTTNSTWTQADQKMNPWPPL